MKNKRQIIFLGHDSNLTGAPVLLYNLIKLISNLEEYNIKVILYRDGPIADLIRTCSPVYSLKSKTYGRTKFFLSKLLNYLVFIIRQQKVLKMVKCADVIFNNTIANGQLLKKIAKFNLPVVSYIHELQSVIKYYEFNNSPSLTMSLSDMILFPSLAVKNNLESNFAIEAKNLKYFPYYFPPLSLEENHQYADQEFFFKKNSIPPGKFYVVGMGRATLRKGIDLFIQTCKVVSALNEDICFVWVGDFEEMKLKVEMEKYVADNHLHNSLVITGDLKHSPYNLLHFDLLFLSSREDPYPLVVLEAAQLKIPCIYFNDSGGIGEFTEEDAGWGIPYGDINIASETILTLHLQMQVLKQKGLSAYNKVNLRHTDSTKVANTFKAIIDQLLITRNDN